MDMNVRGRMLQKIIDWGQDCADVRALALVGSGARLDHPADEWSDIDLVLVAGNPRPYLETTDWLGAIGECWITTVERDGVGRIVERRVLFRNGMDVDWIVLAPGEIGALQEEPLRSIRSRGMRVLVDKAGVLPSPTGGDSGVGRANPPADAPTCEEFSELVDDFWFHAVWTAKKLRRGELWTAKSCCDVYMKRLLVTMIAWHARALDDEKETWYNGRFIEHWADAGVLESLPGIFAHYNAEDIRKALLNTMRLFDQVAREAANCLGYGYPGDKAREITAWVEAKRA